MKLQFELGVTMRNPLSSFSSQKSSRLIETSYMIYTNRVYESFQTTGIKCNFTSPSSEFLQTRFHEYQFHENCPGSQDAINVLMTSLIRRISRSKNRRGIFQLVVRWMGRESHRDGKTGKSAAGRIRLSRELRGNR